MPDTTPPRAPRLGPQTFERLARFVTDASGIRMPPSRRTMLETRLVRRLSALGLDSFDDYCDLVLAAPDGHAERTALIDAVTTNKTLFFRETAHFDHLVSVALPALARGGAGVSRPLRVWSAGCSSGEEPYTIAMVLAEQAVRGGPLPHTVLGTDVSSRVLRQARDAVYRADQVEGVPPALRPRYLLRSRDPARGLFRVAPELRGRVQFAALNFVDRRWSVLGPPFDVIFCRNVLIYFDRPTQEQIVGRLARHLVPSGFLYLGHSETIHGMAVPLATVAPTVHVRTGR